MLSWQYHEDIESISTFVSQPSKCTFAHQSVWFGNKFINTLFVCEDWKFLLLGILQFMPKSDNGLASRPGGDDPDTESRAGEQCLGHRES